MGSPRYKANSKKEGKGKRMDRRGRELTMREAVQFSRAKGEASINRGKGVCSVFKILNRKREELRTHMPLEERKKLF